MEKFIPHLLAFLAFFTVFFTVATLSSFVRPTRNLEEKSKPGFEPRYGPQTRTYCVLAFLFVLTSFVLFPVFLELKQWVSAAKAAGDVVGTRQVLFSLIGFLAVVGVGYCFLLRSGEFRRGKV